MVCGYASKHQLSERQSGFSWVRLRSPGEESNHVTLSSSFGKQLFDKLCLNLDSESSFSVLALVVFDRLILEP